jgi:serine O-acetyltransferase
LTIGARAKVGSNAVVVKNVPPGTTAVGNPARIIDTEQAQKREERRRRWVFPPTRWPAVRTIPGQGDSWPARSCGRNRSAHRLLLKKLEGSGVCIEDEMATADKFDPQYLSKIVD